MGAGEWSVDMRAIEAVGLLTRLKSPVKVRITALRCESARYHGYKGRGRGRYHLITVGKGQTAGEADWGIWWALGEAAEREGRRVAAPVNRGGSRSLVVAE